MLTRTPNDTTATHFTRRTHSLSPTLVLPALATLHTCNATYVGVALQALRDVYFPHTQPLMTMGAVPVLKQSLKEAVQALGPKRTTCFVHQDNVPDSGYASAEEGDQDKQEVRSKEMIDQEAIDQEDVEDDDDDDKLDLLRADEFERGYAIRWLTGLVKRGDTWVCRTGSSFASSEEREARTTRLEDASRLLAHFAGDDLSEEALTRTFIFPFRMPPCRRCHYWNVSSPAFPITVELNDAPVDGSDHTAVGLQSWGSAIVFAERICSNPERYLGTLHPCTSIPATMTARQCRLLELGAGTGLLSIAAAQVLSRTSVQAKVKATDYHPSVLENLAWNARHNYSTVNVSVEKLDWCAVFGSEGVGAHASVDGDEGVGAGVGAYDVVLAADVVYEPEHARRIRGCVSWTLKKGGVFWLIIPMRTIGRHAGLPETVGKAFPPVGGGLLAERVGSGEGGKERLAIVRREEVERIDGVGRADEAGYTLFEIRWVVD